LYFVFNVNEFNEHGLGELAKERALPTLPWGVSQPQFREERCPRQVGVSTLLLLQEKGTTGSEGLRLKHGVAAAKRFFARPSSAVVPFQALVWVSNTTACAITKTKDLALVFFFTTDLVCSQIAKQKVFFLFFGNLLLAPKYHLHLTVRLLSFSLQQRTILVMFHWTRPVTKGKGVNWRNKEGGKEKRKVIELPGGDTTQVAVVGSCLLFVSPSKGLF